MPDPSDSTPEHEHSPPLRRVRRAPKFPQFMIVGGIIGLVVGVIAGMQGESGDYSGAAAVGLFAFFFAGVGVLVAAGIAIFLDRRSLR